MKIDLSNLEEIGSYKKIEGKLPLTGIEFRSQEIEVPDPFSLNLKIYKSKNNFVLTGSIAGDLILECSRCLEPYRHHLELDINKEIEKAEIEDIKAYNLTPIIKHNIILAIPMKPLCSEDCEGLCPKCGQNLNEGQCDCDTESVDPRLAKLKDFLDD